MAEAVEALFPGVKFWVGPALDNGFYYDMDLGDRQMSEETALEQKMGELARQNNIYIREEISKKDAVSLFFNRNDEYKLDLLHNLEDGNITLYKQGQFTDLCRGPHIPSTGHIKAIKLTNIAGAYWKGNEKIENVDPRVWCYLPQCKIAGRTFDHVGRGKKVESSKVREGIEYLYHE